MAFFRMALCNVGRNSRRSLITISTMLFGIFIVFSIRAFLNGFQTELKNLSTEKLYGDIQIHKQGYQDNVSGNPFDYLIDFNGQIQQEIVEIPGVNSATGNLITFALINNQRTQKSAMAAVAGIDSVGEEAVCPRFANGLIQGNFLDSQKERWAIIDREDITLLEEAAGLGEEDLWDIESAESIDKNSKTIDQGFHQIMLSPSLMRGLGAKIGDEIILLTTDKYDMQQALVCILIGEIGSNLPMMANKLAWIDLATVQRLLRCQGEVSSIKVRINNTVFINSIQYSLITTINNPLLTIERWDQVLGAYATIMQFQDIVSSVIISLVLILAAFAITNTSMMTVMERYREIGTLMSLGYKRRHIIRIFLTESLIIGCIGALGGIALSVITIFLINLKGITIVLGEADAVMVIFPAYSGFFIIFIVAIAFIVTLLASFYPALRASRLKPVEALASV